MGWSKQAIDFLEKLRGIKKFELTPQEKQLLNISDNVIDYLKDPQQTKQTFNEGLKDLIKESLKNKKYVYLVRNKPEQARDLLGAFLRHLRSNLPAENISFIESDTLEQAKKLLSEVAPAVDNKEAPVADPLSKVEPLPATAFEPFNLKSPDELTNLSEQEIADRYLSYFLGKTPKEVTTEKGIKKREYSPFFKENKNNPELLKKYLMGFYRLVRDVKNKSGKTDATNKWVFSPTIDRTADKDIQNAIISESKRKQEMGYDKRTSDIPEVMKTIRHALNQIKSLKKDIGSSTVQKKYKDLLEKAQRALPTVRDIEVYLNDINDEIQNLNISKSDFDTLYENTVSDNLGFTEPDIDKKLSELLSNMKSYVFKGNKPEKREEVEEITKEVMAAKRVVKKVIERDKAPDSGISEIEDYLANSKDSDTKQVEVLKNRYNRVLELKSKDFSRLNDLINSYVDMLATYLDRNKENFSGVDISDIDAVVKDFNDFAKVMTDLSKEQEFGFMWGGSSRIFPKSPEKPDSKIAAFKSHKYQDAFSKFQSASSALKKIDTITSMSQPGGLLDQVKKKLLSGAEASAEDTYNDFGEDYSNNPLAGKPVRVTIDTKDGEEQVDLDARGLAKRLVSIGNSLKNIKPEKMLEQATSILKGQADLESVFTFPRTNKKAYAQVIRKFAYNMVQAIKENKGPGVLLYRQRQTPMGRRFLTDIFKDDKYIQEFIREMEKAGMGALAEHDKWDKKEQPEGDKSTKNRGEVEQDRLKSILTDKVDVFNILTKILNKMFKETRSKDKENYKEKPLDEILTHFIGAPRTQAFKNTNELKSAKENYKNILKNLYKIDIELGGSGSEIIDEKELKNLGFDTEGINSFRDELSKIDSKSLRSIKDKEELINKLFPIVNDPDKLFDIAKGSNYSKLNSLLQINDILKETEEGEKKYWDILTKGEYQTDKGPDTTELDKVKDDAQLHMQFMSGGAPTTEKGKKFLKLYNSFTGKNLSELPTLTEINSLKDSIGKIPELGKKKKEIDDFFLRSNTLFKPDKAKMDLGRSEMKKKMDVRRVIGDPTWSKKVFNRNKDIRNIYTEINKELRKTEPGVKNILPAERLEDVIKRNEDNRKIQSTIKAVINKSERLLKLERFYKSWVDYHDALKNKISKSEQAVKDLGEIVSSLETLKASDASEDDKKKAIADSLSAAKAILGFNEDSDLQAGGIKRELTSQERALPELKKELEKLNKERPLYDNYLKRIKENSDSFMSDLEEARNPGSEIAKLRKELLDLNKKKTELSSNTSLAPGAKNSELKGIDKRISEIDDRIKSLQINMVKKTAAVDSYGPQKSQYDVAIETKGEKPQKYEEELKPSVPFKSQGYIDQFNYSVDVFKQRLKVLSNIKESSPEMFDKNYSKEYKFLLGVLKTADTIKNTLIKVGNDSVPIFDSLKKLSDLIEETLEDSSGAMSRRDNYMKLLNKTKEKIENLRTYIDTDTGEATEIPKSELESYKKMILKSLYSALESHWANPITKQLSPLGERDNEYYNKVYDFFRQTAGVKSNRKLMGILNGYKTSIRREIDDSENWDKIEELQKAKDALLAGYKQFGADPEKSSRLQSLATRINTLTKHKKQIRNIFDEMAGLVNLATNEAVEKKISEEIGEDNPRIKDKLSEKKEKAENKVEKGLEQVVGKGSNETIESIAGEVIGLAKGTDLEKQIEKLLGDISKTRKQNKEKSDFSKDDTKKSIKEKSSVITTPEELTQSSSFVLSHAKGDNKYVFVVENNKDKKYLLDSGLLKPDPKGRKKGTEYIKDGKKIYDVKVDMYEFPGVTSKNGAPAGVWVGKIEDIKKQIQAIKEGSDSGTFFTGTIKGGDKGLPVSKERVEVETTKEEKTPDKVVKASYREDVNFNERILYSDTIQKKISSLLDNVIKKVRE